MNAGDTRFCTHFRRSGDADDPRGLALFYGGMVRSKNILGTLMQSFIILGLITLEWVLWGYTMSFGPDHGGHYRRAQHVRLKRSGNGTKARTTAARSRIWHL